MFLKKFINHIALALTEKGLSGSKPFSCEVEIIYTGKITWN